MATSSSDRPSLNRKHTPKTEAARKSQFDEGIRITYEGKKYEVRAGDLNALDAQALRRELGMSFMGLCNAMARDPDIDLIAGVVWLARRADESNLPYAEVAAGMRYDAFDNGFELDLISEPETAPEA